MPHVTIDDLLTSLRTTMAMITELSKDQTITIDFYESSGYQAGYTFRKNGKFTAKLKLTKEYS